MILETAFSGCSTLVVTIWIFRVSPTVKLPVAGVKDKVAAIAADAKSQRLKPTNASAIFLDLKTHHIRIAQL